MKKPSKPAAKVKAAVMKALPEDKRYMAESALHTLKRAHEIKNDPQLMAHVRQHAKHEKAALSKVIGRK